MSAYGDITCEWCGAIYDERELHICEQDSLTSEIGRLRQRVKELEEELTSPVIESEWQELQRKYKERGERMKEMRDALDARGTYWVAYQKWFDPETKEPL